MVKFIKYNTFSESEFPEFESMREKILKEMLERQTAWIEKTIREFAVPRITGEITKEKIIEMNLEMHSASDLENSAFYITQYGKQIGEKFFTSPTK
jgi:hypothetical protein